MQNILDKSVNLILPVVALIMLIPLFLILACLIKFSSPGPVFFKQLRVGKDRKEFYMIKFRTMINNAEKNGPLVTALGDSRITLVGNFLRRTKIDELPVLWNVIIGDMNLVGPRPEVLRYVQQYQPEWDAIFSVKPGITDLATLQFRDEESCLIGASDREQAYVDIIIPIKIKLALDYLDKQSFWFDIKILILTVWAITIGRIFVKPSNQLAKIAKDKVKVHRKQ